VLLLHLQSLKADQALQAHGKDGIRLPLGEGEPLHQPAPRLLRPAAGADDMQHLVQVEQRHPQPLQHMRTLLRPGQKVGGAAAHHLHPVLHVVRDELLDVEGLGAAVGDGDEHDAEGDLQGRVLKELVAHHLGVGPALELHRDARARLVALVAYVGHVIHRAALHGLGDLAHHRLAVDVVRDLGDDDAEAVLAGLFDAGAGAHGDGAPPRGVALGYPLSPADDAPGGEIGPGHYLQQLPYGHLGFVHDLDDGVAQLPQVVGRDAGGHAHRYAAGSVGQQVGKTGRQDHRLLARALVVVREVNGVQLDVCEHLRAGRAETGRRVAHRRGGVCVERAEVALAVNERIAVTERLPHAHEGVVDGNVTVGVVVPVGVADYLAALAVLGAGAEAQLVHGHEYAPLHGLEAVARVRQGAADDDAHRKRQVGLAHLVLDEDAPGHVGGLGAHDGSGFPAVPAASGLRLAVPLLAQAAQNPL